MIAEGIFLYNSGFYEHAITQFEKALLAAEKENNWRVIVIIHCNLGECHFQLKQYPIALTAYDRAYTIAKVKNDSHFLAVIQIYISRVLLVQLKLDQAESHLRNALKLFEQLNDLHGLMIVYGFLGDLKAQTLFPMDGLFYYEKAADYARTLNHLEFEKLFLLRIEALNRDQPDEYGPYPFIFTFPHPSGPPAMSGGQIQSKKLFCPSCDNQVFFGSIYCPKCAIKLPVDYYI